MPVTIYTTLSKTALDATSDQPVNARAQLEAAVDALNSLRSLIDSIGITQPGNGIEIIAAGAGIKDGLSVKLDGSSLSRSAAGLRVADAGILLAMLGQNGATNGQIIVWDSSLNAGAGGWKVASPSSSGNQKLKKAVFGSSGSSNWTVPTGVTEAKAMVIAGGGAGAGVNSAQTGAGGGGAGGGWAFKWLTGLTPGNVINVTVGASAGDSYVGPSGSPLCKATAGGSVSNNTGTGQTGAQAGGSPGVGTIGDILGAGEPGSPGLGTAGWMLAGKGGGSIFGGGGVPALLTANGRQGGSNGAAPGAGGSGAVMNNSGTTIGAGFGAVGLVLLEWIEA